MCLTNIKNNNNRKEKLNKIKRGKLKEPNPPIHTDMHRDVHTQTDNCTYARRHTDSHTHTHTYTSCH